MSANLHVTDFSLLFGLGGLFVSIVWFQLRRSYLIPVRDPRLAIPGFRKRVSMTMTESTDQELRTETSGHTKAATDKLSIALMFLSAIAVFTAVIVFTSAVYFDVERQEVIEKRAIGNLEVQQFREEQQQLLNEYRWIDKSSGVVGIPVEQAIEALLNERNSPQRF